MRKGILGKNYPAGSEIIREGDNGDCMYVIQAGKAGVFKELDDKEVKLAELIEGDFFGEMAIFEQEVRSASVRALEDVRVLTIDKKNFLSRIHEDPTVAFNLVKTLSHRIRLLNNQHTRIKGSDRRNWDTRPEQYSLAGN